MSYDDDDNGSDLVKDLRKQLDEAKAEAKSLRKENEGLVAYKIKVTVDDVIAEKGLNPKIKALIPKDVEDVSSWLDEYGDLFGVTPSTDAASDDAGAADEVDELDRQNAIEDQGAGDTGLLAKIEATTDLAELENLLRGAS